jgi:glycosyltransferase involved in cell wall biosynthesis
MLPKVTILVPTYKRANLLEVAIKSALAQTYTNTEILVLDDESPDNTPEVMRKFLAEPRITYVRHKKNKGIAENWRFGFEQARGEYLTILHDDDTFEPDYVATLLKPLEEDKSLILAFCDQWCIDEQGNRLTNDSDIMSKRFGRDRLHRGPLADFARSALVDLSIPVGASLFRRSWLKSGFIAPEAKGAIDVWLFYQCVQTGGSAFYEPRRLMNYRTHDSGMSAAMPLYMGEGHLFRQRSILQNEALRAIHPEIDVQMRETLVSYAIAQLRTGNRRIARQSIRETLQRGQRGLRPLAVYALSCGGWMGTQIARRLRS